MRDVCLVRYFLPVIVVECVADAIVTHQDTDGDSEHGEKRVKDIYEVPDYSDTLDSTPFRVPPPTLSVHEVTPNLRRSSSRASAKQIELQPSDGQHEQVTSVARYKSRKQSSLFNSIFE